MSKTIRIIVGIFAALVMVLGLSACEGTPGDGQQSESKAGQKNYDGLVKADPAHDMKYSPTRKTINFFTDTWGQRGKLAYTYLMNNEGKVISYLVTEGPPVSLCVSIRPSYKLLDPQGDGVGPNLVVPAPSADGAYYGGSGSCNTFYGKDANTGAYVQYTAGQGINPLLYDQPLAPQIVGDAINLGNVK